MNDAARIEEAEPAPDSDNDTIYPFSPVPRARLVPRDGVIRPVKIGAPTKHLGDYYIKLVSITWKRLISIIVSIYLLANLVFGLVYYFTDGIANARPGSFADDFFFSVQTLATIGYGNMYPTGFAANLVVVAEAFTGFIFYALVTGLLFSKFSRPTARVLFSEVAVICPYDGKLHLMLRMANQRNNRIVDARVHLVLLRREISKEGTRMRRFYDLKPVRHRIPMLQLTWTVMHEIDEESPLYNMTAETLKETDAEIIVSLTGLDETFSQTVHARHSFVADELIYGSVFEDVIAIRDDGRPEINYTRFHSTRKIELMQIGVALNLSEAGLIVSRKLPAELVVSFCPAVTQLLERHGYKVSAASQHYLALSHAKAAVLIERDLKTAKTLQSFYGLSDAQQENLGVYLYQFLCLSYYLYFSTRSHNRASNRFFWIADGKVKGGDYRDMFLDNCEQGKGKITSYANTHVSYAHYLLATACNRLLARKIAASGRKKILDLGDHLPSKITGAMLDSGDSVIAVATRKMPKNMYKSARIFLKSLAACRTPARGKPVWFFRAADPALYKQRAALPAIALAYPEVTQAAQVAIQGHIPFLKAQYGIGQERVALLKPEMVISDYAMHPFMLAAQEAVHGYGGVVAMMSHGSHTAQSGPISRIAGNLWAAQDRVVTPFVTELLPKSPLTFAMMKDLHTGQNFQMHKLNLFEDIQAHPSPQDEFIILHASNFSDLYLHIPWCRETSEEYLLAIYELLEEMRHIEGAKLVIKLKASKAHLHKDLVQRRIDELGIGNKAVIDTHTSFCELLAKTSLVVSSLSTTVEEALINHIPVMIHSYYKTYFHIPEDVLSGNGLNPAYLAKKRGDIKDIIQFVQKHRENLFDPALYKNVAWQKKDLTTRQDFATELLRKAGQVRP